MNPFLFSLIILSSSLLVQCSSNSHWLYTSFESAMNIQKYPLKTVKWPKNANHFFYMLKHHYDNHNPSKKNLNTKNKIPKIIHQIWLGSEFPEKFKPLVESWKKFHPDWEYKLWTEKEINSLKMSFRDLYDRETKYAKKANIARYEILYQFGGLYIDTDYECLKSFDILHDNYDFYAGCPQLDEGFVYVCNALIACKPGHPIMKHCIEQLGPDSHYLNGLQRNGTLHFTKSCAAHLKSGNNIILPGTYFYPLGCESKEMPKKEIDKLIPQHPESFAIHYWDASWVKNKK